MATTSWFIPWLSGEYVLMASSVMHTRLSPRHIPHRASFCLHFHRQQAKHTKTFPVPYKKWTNCPRNTMKSHTHSPNKKNWQNVPMLVGICQRIQRMEREGREAFLKEGWGILVGLHSVPSKPKRRFVNPMLECGCRMSRLSCLNDQKGCFSHLNKWQRSSPPGA